MSQVSTPRSPVTAQPTLMKLETYNYCQNTLHAKWYFDLTTWVVWANTQFATVRLLFVDPPVRRVCMLKIRH